METYWMALPHVLYVSEQICFRVCLVCLFVWTVMTAENILQHLVCVLSSTQTSY